MFLPPRLCQPQMSVPGSDPDPSGPVLPGPKGCRTGRQSGPCKSSWPWQWDMRLQRHQGSSFLHEENYSLWPERRKTHRQEAERFLELVRSLEEVVPEAKSVLPSCLSAGQQFLRLCRPSQGPLPIFVWAAS